MQADRGTGIADAENPSREAPHSASVAALSAWQRSAFDARLMVLDHIRRRELEFGRTRAITLFLDDLRSGALPDHLATAAYLANARRGSRRRRLSRSSIFRWFAQEKRSQVALVPRVATRDTPSWAAALLRLYRKPNKPSLRRCVEDLKVQLPRGVVPPSYHACARFIARLSEVERQAGRMGPRALKALLPFVRRDTSKLLPGDVYTADGHRFDAEIAHPRHGRPFRPELITILDVATRRVVGWSVDVNESGLAVLDAIRHACMTSSDFAIFYVDRGSGFHNALLSEPGIGMTGRLGFQITHSLPYNSQARGISERAHQTIWVNAARELPTFVGQSMDDEARGKVFRLVRRELKAGRRSAALTPWASFISYCDRIVRTYNERPHRSLVKHEEDDSPQSVMTPNEAWEAGRASGASLRTLTTDEAIDLFRPMKECKALRGEVRLFGNTYFAADLLHYHSETVRVAFDIHDASRVIVRDADGRFVAIATLNGNRVDYFPESFVERSRRERAQSRLRRARAKIDDIQSELTTTAPGREPPTARQATRIRLLSVAHNEPASSGSEYHRYVSLMQQRTKWTAHDRAWLASFAQDPLYELYRDVFERNGIAWPNAKGAA